MTAPCCYPVIEIGDTPFEDRHRYLNSGHTDLNVIHPTVP